MTKPKTQTKHKAKKRTKVVAEKPFKPYGSSYDFAYKVTPPSPRLTMLDVDDIELGEGYTVRLSVYDKDYLLDATKTADLPEPKLTPELWAEIVAIITAPRDCGMCIWHGMQTENRQTTKQS